MYLIKYIKKNLCAVSIFLISFIIIMACSFIGIDPLHQGFMLKTSSDVADGMTLFKDTYTQYGPLVIYIQAVFVKVFGQSVWAVNLAAVLFEALSFYFIYKLLIIYLNKIISLFICMFILSLHYVYLMEYLPWSSSFSLLFTILTIYFWVLYTHNRKNIEIILMGISSSLCFWTRQPVGIVMWISIAIISVFLFLQNRKLKYGYMQIVYLWTAVIAVNLFFCGIFLFQGSLKDWWMQDILGMFEFAKNKDTSNGMSGFMSNLFGRLFPARYGLFWSVVPFLNLVLFVIVFFDWIRGFIKRKDLEYSENLCLLGCLIFSAASWHQYYPVVCYRHMYWAIFPGIAICIIVLLQYISRYINNNALFVFILLGMIFLCSDEWVSRINTIRSRIHDCQAVIYNEEYPLFNYQKVTYEIGTFYDNLFEKVREIKNKYPESEFYNNTSISSYSCLQETNRFAIHTKGEWVYDGLSQQKLEYCMKEKPIIFSYDRDFNLGGYEAIYMFDEFDGNIYNGKNLKLGIYVPKDHFKSDLIKNNRIYGDFIKNKNQFIEIEPEKMVHGPNYILAPGRYKFRITADLDHEDELAVSIETEFGPIAFQNLETGYNEIEFEIEQITKDAAIRIYNSLDSLVTIRSMILEEI